MRGSHKQFLLCMETFLLFITKWYIGLGVKIQGGGEVDLNGSYINGERSEV